MNMTLEQVRQQAAAMRKWLSEMPAFWYGNDNIRRSAEMLDEYAAYLARQSEGVSDEMLKLFNSVYEREWERAAADDEAAGKIQGLTADDIATRSALTAVWHNRPAQEKAEPVGEFVGSGVIKQYANGKTYPPGTKVYTAPPAERVRVPENGNE